MASKEWRGQVFRTRLEVTSGEDEKRRAPIGVAIHFGNRLDTRLVPVYESEVEEEPIDQEEVTLEFTFPHAQIRAYADAAD